MKDDEKPKNHDHVDLDFDKIIAAEEGTRYYGLEQHCANCVAPVENCAICRKIFPSTGSKQRADDVRHFIEMHHGGLHAFNGKKDES